MTDSESLARAWVCLQENWWAHDTLNDASDPELVWSVICRVLDGSPSANVLEVTAAGPLESFLRTHAASFIDRLETVAQSHQGWGNALRLTRIPPSDDPITQRLFTLGCARLVSVSGLPRGFVGDVREYVELIESSGSVALLEFLARSAELLARIYSASFELPAIHQSDAKATAQRPSPLKRLSEQLGGLDLYWCIFNARVQDEPVVGSLADDLADIYLELASGLDELDAGRHENALWAWRFALFGHAGDHLVRLLPAIHAILHEQGTRLTTGRPTPA